MIEFIEYFHADGSMSARLLCSDLPKGEDARDYSYTIKCAKDSRCETKSRSAGNGSVRYGFSQSYEAAQESAIAWARRKIAEARR